MSLLGPDGMPISSKGYAEKRGPGRPKKAKPVLGEAFGNWAGRTELTSIPGLEAIQFDPSRLTIADFRRMSEHYQISSSLMVLSFMMHQLDWHIECEDKRIKEQAEENLNRVWTRLVRSMSSAFKFGFSPNVLQWKNGEKYLEIDKIKDLLHEECSPRWKLVDGPQAELGTIRKKFKVYDGIKQWNSGDIPVENSFWYPLLMKYGDYGGTKLLRSAFQPWFFSSLIHLYQNRYFERFGEPVPVGRAPYDDKIDINGKSVSGPELMTQVLEMIRSRSAVVLPSDTTQTGSSNVDRYDYDVSYIESQMRGADFERYLARLDEEMSLSLFTPLLLLKTAEGGGFNQAISHTTVYLWMLNAIAGDWKEYIDKYILKPIAVYNFGPKAKLPEIKFRRMGTAQQETLRSMVQAMIYKDQVKPDLVELGQHIGVDLHEIEYLINGDGDLVPDYQIKPGEKPYENINKDDPTSGTKDGSPSARKVDVRDRAERTKSDGARGVDNPRSTTKAITQRLADQVSRAYRDGSFDSGFWPSIGHSKQLAEEMKHAGVRDPRGAAAVFAQRVSALLHDAAGLGTGGYAEPADFMATVEAVLEIEYSRAVQ